MAGNPPSIEGVGEGGEAYPGSTYELSQVKRRYDPDNLFRSNQGVPPAG
jgi:FAD/FMN-containing dehydrogenase